MKPLPSSCGSWHSKRPRSGSRGEDAGAGPLGGAGRERADGLLVTGEQRGSAHHLLAGDRLPYRPEEGWPVGNVVGKLGFGRLGFVVGKVGLVVGIDGLLCGYLPGSTVTLTPPETLTVGTAGFGAFGFGAGTDGLPGFDG